MREESYTYPFMYIAGKTNMIVKKHISKAIYQTFSNTPLRYDEMSVRNDMKESIMKVIKVQ